MSRCLNISIYYPGPCGKGEFYVSQSLTRRKVVQIIVTKILDMEIVLRRTIRRTQQSVNVRMDGLVLIVHQVYNDIFR